MTNNSLVLHGDPALNKNARQVININKKDIGFYIIYYQNTGRISKVRDPKGNAYFELNYLKVAQPNHSLIHGHKINFFATTPKKIWSAPINNLWKTRW